ncbi:hypothetical protein FUAX_54440 (plasmid) [Fulvitalea axinellae]|uniref:Exo-alpha-sialidase n=1 Tax=Fulvitalea axinellae TaxID=1182444 RepID=A0AAU9D6J9_9BACT|nr:hypothetical protein FUAX_54440 [Fulvitalea axinellae]
MRLHTWVILLILATIISCSSNIDSNPVKMEWTEIVNTGKPIDYCQIDSVSNGYILTYSHSPAIAGGFKIIRMNTLSEGDLEKTYLFESNNNTTQFVSVKGNDIGFVQYDFEENTLRSKFFISHNLGEIWNEIRTPLEGGMRNFILMENSLFVEGNLKGTGQTFESLNRGQTWSSINTLKKGFKSFFLLRTANNRILCKGFKSFNYKDGKLLLFDTQNNSIQELINIDGNSFSYLKPISKEKNLHIIIDGNKLKIYSLQKEEMILREKFRLPDNTSWVENVFLDREYYIVTVREKKLTGKKISWISYDNGKNWRPLEHEKRLKLIYNTFGRLFMIDINNDILRRK